jgi:hypothetical protein
MTDDPDDRTAEDLREQQTEKARDERRHAEGATEEHEAVTHDRRSEKAAYLAAKLAEQERSEEQRSEQETGEKEQG